MPGTYLFDQLRPFIKPSLRKASASTLHHGQQTYVTAVHIKYRGAVHNLSPDVHLWHLSLMSFATCGFQTRPVIGLRRNSAVRQARRRRSTRGKLDAEASTLPSRLVWYRSGRTVDSHGPASQGHPCILTTLASHTVVIRGKCERALVCSSGTSWRSCQPSCETGRYEAGLNR